jgi:hypothetical protein
VTVTFVVTVCHGALRGGWPVEVVLALLLGWDEDGLFGGDELVEASADLLDLSSGGVGPVDGCGGVARGDATGGGVLE